MSKNMMGVNENTERQLEDFYATDPIAVKLLLEKIKFVGDIWECACGEGHLSEEIKKAGYNVISTDKYNRGVMVKKKLIF